MGVGMAGVQIITTVISCPPPPGLLHKASPRSPNYFSKVAYIYAIECYHQEASDVRVQAPFSMFN